MNARAVMQLEAKAKDLFEVRAPVSVTDWAEKNVVLTRRVTPNPGPYRASHCPYVREPQDRSTEPGVHTLVLCWASRSSKTETGLNIVRYHIAEDPCSMIIAQPTDRLAKSFSETRLQPSIDDSPILAAQKPDDLDRYKLLEMHFRKCTVWLVGANSPATLKGRGVRLLFCDEIDTWKGRTEKETGALQQILERTKDRWNWLHILTSTPTIASGQIWQEFLLGTQHYYHVPCPHCRERFAFEMDGIWLDPKAQDKDGKWNLARIKETAYYVCPHCKGKIEDHHKATMLDKGTWIQTNPNAEPGRLSYHLNSIYPLWITFADVAIMFLKSKGSPEELQRFINSWLALPYYAFGDAKETQKKMESLKDAAAAPGTPEGSKTLLYVDVQADRVYAVARWHLPNRDSGMVEHAMLPGLEEAEMMAHRLGCALRFVDAGHFQQRVLEFCATHQLWIPTIGSDRLFPSLRWTDMPIDAGMLKGRSVKSLRLRPLEFKEMLYDRMTRQGKPGIPKWTIRPDVSTDYMAQMSGEQRTERKGPRGRIYVEYVEVGPNHYWDCESNQIACIEAVRSFVFDMKDEEPPGPPPAMPARVERPQEPQQGGAVSESEANIWQNERPFNLNG